MGTLPKTNLLLTRNKLIIDSFSGYADIGRAIGAYVSDMGVVYYKETPQNPCYLYDPSGKNLNSYHTKESILSDWVRCYFYDSNYKIYRYLT